jgi:hypothetical protein
MRKLLVAASLVAIVTSLIPTARAADPPRNDNFGNAIEIAELPFQHDVDLRKATKRFDDPSCRDAGHTVWYSYTPSEDIRLLPIGRGRRVWPVVSVWTEEAGVLTEVICDDYQPVFEAVAGTTYYIMVGTYGNRRGGKVTFKLREAPPPPTATVTVDPVVTIDPLTEEVTVNGTITCTNTQWQDLYGSVRQLINDRQFIGAYFYGLYDFECDGTVEPWTASEVGNGVFIDGPAFVEVESYACSRWECVEYEEILSVTVDRP